MKSSRKSNKTKEKVYNLIQVRENNENPDITIVTNGEYITNELIDKIHQYNGKAKFNISLHSLNPADYGRITKNIQKVKEIEDEIASKIQLIKMRDLTIK